MGGARIRRSRVNGSSINASILKELEQDVRAGEFQDRGLKIHLRVPDELTDVRCARIPFEQPDEHAASEQLRRVADGLAARFPAVADLLTEAEPDLLVHFTFPDAHRPRIRSTNPQERLNKEIPVFDCRCRRARDGGLYGG